MFIAVLTGSMLWYGIKYFGRLYKPTESTFDNAPPFDTIKFGTPSLLAQMHPSLMAMIP